MGVRELEWEGCTAEREGEEGASGEVGDCVMGERGRECEG